MKKGIFVILMVCMVLTSDNVYAKAFPVELMAVTDSGHDHTSFMSKINSYLNKMGYTDEMILQTIEAKTSSLKPAFSYSDVIVTRSHGGRFLDSSGNPIGNWIVMSDSNYYNSDIENLEDNALSGVKLIAFVGCYTAAGGSSNSSKNLIVEANKKGADVAIGFMDTINCSGANYWVKRFFKHLADGKNVDTAANEAVRETKIFYSTLEADGELRISSMRYIGDWSLSW